MRHKSKRNRKTSPTYRFEQLEPRYLFDISPILVPQEAPETPLETHLEGDPQPTDDISSGDQPLTQQGAGDVDNYGLQPNVDAGDDASISLLNSLQLNGKVLVNRELNLEIVWSKLSGPGEVEFSNPWIETPTVRFDQPGTYELQLKATNNHDCVGTGSVFVEVTPANVINIDQAWLNQQGDGPYYLDQADTAYILQTDVTTDGTAFAIIAQNVTFDLNGHTITYDNATPIAITNHSFETGSGQTAEGWDFTNVGDTGATIHAPVDTNAAFLDNEIYDGVQSLKFTDTTESGYIESTGTITLEADTRYVLSAMFDYGDKATNPGVKGYVRLVGDGLPTIEVSRITTNIRGISCLETVFVVGETQAEYTIQVGIEGHESGTLPFYIDDIKVVRTRTYGIALNPNSWQKDAYGVAYMYDVTRFGSSPNAHILNGSIVQGQNGSRCHAIYSYNQSDATIEDMNITVAGQNCSIICDGSSASGTYIVKNNIFTSNVPTITNRDAHDGSMLDGTLGVVYGNTFLNGPMDGIYLGKGHDVEISHNTFRMKAKYSNSACTAFYDAKDNISIHNNTIECTGDYYITRGIHLHSGGTASQPTLIYNNTINVDSRANIQEYGGGIQDGTYVIQFESNETMPVYAELFNNTITATATEVQGAVLRFNGPNLHISVHDNDFIAVNNGAMCKILDMGDGNNQKYGQITNDNVDMYDNTFTTNDGIAASTYTAFDIKRTHLTVSDPVASPKIFRALYQNVARYPLIPSTELSFIDTTFEDETSSDYFKNATISYGSGTSSWFAFESNWSTTIKVVDSTSNLLVGAAVTIKDKDANLVFSGTTDDAGKVFTTLTEFYTTSNIKMDYSPFTVTASFEGEQIQQQFSADQVQTIELQLPVQAMRFMETVDPLVFGIGAAFEGMLYPVLDDTTQSPSVSAGSKQVIPQEDDQDYMLKQENDEANLWIERDDFVKGDFWKDDDRVTIRNNRNVETVILSDDFDWRLDYDRALAILEMDSIQSWLGSK